MRPWKTLKKETILDFNKFLKVEQHTIELPDGKIIEHWPWVVSPDYALVLPVTEQGTILLFHQVKYAVEGTSYAPVGGHIEPGENSLQLQRENCWRKWAAKQMNGYRSVVSQTMEITVMVKGISFLL